jgi:hypothetical protein
MAYGLKYILNWQAEGTTDSYRVELLTKDYSGGFTTLTPSKSPLVRKALGDDDDVLTNPIKATAATVIYKDEGNITPVSNFYSEDDTYCRADCYGPSGLMWSGFTVLDDCSEDWVDFIHDVALNCSDNLALLKDVSLSEAFLSVNSTTVDPQATLLYLLTTCIKATGLTQIPLDIFLNVFEDSMPDRATDPTACAFAQTVINTNVFLSSDKWDSCWDVIIDILDRFNCKLSQSDGRWIIYRIPELFLYPAGVPGTRYDLTTGTATAVTLSTPQTWGYQQDVHMSVNNPVSRVWRSWQFAKETFNFNQPTNVPENKNLRKLGPLISESITGDIKKSDYQLSGWTGLGGVGAFIRVETNIVNHTEIDRYIHLPYPPLYNDLKYVASTQVLINSGDKFSWSFDFRSGGGDTNFDVLCYLGVKLFLSPSLFKTLTRNGTFEFDVPDNEWAVFSYDGSKDVGEWTNVSSDLFAFFTGGQILVPDDGYLEFRLYQLNPNHPTTIPAEYKGFELTVYSYIEGANTVIGQTHTSTRSTGASKKRNELTIKIDDSPKFSITGAMFTTTLTYGTYRTLTKAWHQYGFAPTGLRLGEIITRNLMAVRKYSRMIFDGTFRGVNGVDFATLVQFPEIPGKVFVFGISTISYGSNTFTVTLWEVYASTDSPDPLTPYFFAYLYQSE